MSELSDADARLLEFEESAPRSIGAKEEAIRAEFGISPVRYYQHLNILIDFPPAIQAYPLLTARLRRRRETRDTRRYRATRR